MAINKYFNQTRRASEQSLYSSLIIESIQIHGVDVLYIKRDNLEIDPVLKEPTMSTFKDTYSIEMYIPESENTGGNQYFMNKMGITYEEIVEAYVSIDRWEEVAGDDLVRPNEGDLVYIGNPNSTYDSFINMLFQIKNVVAGHPESNQFGKNHTFKLIMEQFVSGYETFETDFADIDSEYNIDVKNEFLNAVNEDSQKIACRDVMEQTENPIGENYIDNTTNKPFGTNDYVKKKSKAEKAVKEDTKPTSNNPFGDVF